MILCAVLYSIKKMALFKILPLSQWPMAPPRAAQQHRQTMGQNKKRHWMVGNQAPQNKARGAQTATKTTTVSLKPLNFQVHVPHALERQGKLGGHAMQTHTCFKPCKCQTLAWPGSLWPLGGLAGHQRCLVGPPNLKP